MNLSKQTQVLPKPDGTTSTNYGPQFEISSTAIFVLRSCKLNKKFTVWINYTEYEPWDDIVAEIDGQILCVQLKHNEKLDKNKLNVCLSTRKALLDKHSGQRNNINFVYFATSPDEAIRNNYCALNGDVSHLLKLLVTNSSNLYYDPTSENGSTFFCMNQHNVSGENADVKQALADYIGQHYLSEDHLKFIQTHFQEYIRCRYLRLIKGSHPLTNDEIRRNLAYTMLQKFKIEYKPSSVKIEASNNLEEIMGTPPTSSVVVVNHRWSSNFRAHIWCHLLAHYEQRINRKHLKQANLDELWLDGKIYMPIESPSKDTDKIILRALEIGDYEPKVLILRPRIFKIREGQDVVTLLQPFSATQRAFQATTGVADDSQELFRIAQVDLKGLMRDRNVKLHPDAFTKAYKEYFKDGSVLDDLNEAHDEFHYVNDYNQFGGTEVPALFAALKIKQVDVKVIESLIRLGADLNSSVEGGFKPIFYAVEEGRADLVEVLLRNGANPNLADREGMTVLFNACIQNQVEVADLLIKFGADRSAADFGGVRPLFMAYNNGNFEILRLLLKDFDKAAAANVQGSHILHVVAEDGSMEGLRCILEVCKNVKVFMTGDVMGRTPLDIAVQNGNQEFAQLLQKSLEIK